MVLLLTLEEQGNPARRQHKRQRSHGIAQAAVAHGLVRSRHGLVAAEPHADDQGIVRESLPCVEPVHAVNGCDDLILPTGALRVAQELPVCGDVQVQHPILIVGSREISPISAQQQRCVVALGEYIAQVIGEVVRVDGKHHHAAKAVALADRVRHLHRPLPRHPAQCGAADVEALFRLRGVGLEVGTVSDRCAQCRTVG